MTEVWPVVPKGHSMILLITAPITYDFLSYMISDPHAAESKLVETISGDFDLQVGCERCKESAVVIMAHQLECVEA